METSKNQRVNCKCYMLYITFATALYNNNNNNIYSIGYIYNFYIIILLLSMSYEKFVYNFCITFV